MSNDSNKKTFSLEANVGISDGLAKVIVRIADALEKYRNRVREAKDNRWEIIFFTVDEVRTLTDSHMEAVNEVVKPIIEYDDLPKTYQRFKLLVNNKNFPDAYQEYKGTLLSAYNNWPEFRRNPEKEHLRDLISEIVLFQAAVFMRRYKDDKGNLVGESIDSLLMADAFLESKNLWEIYSARNPELPPSKTDLEKEDKIKGKLDRFYVHGWIKRFVPEGQLKSMSEIHNNEDLIEFVKVWCKGWQRNIQNQLTIDGRLIFQINQLKADRFR